MYLVRLASQCRAFSSVIIFSIFCIDVCIVFLIFSREYECPQPDTRAILDCVSRFKQAVNCSLKSGSVGNNCIRIEFRLDVFRFLFCDKGQPPISGRGLIYDLDDFDDRYFVGEWYRRYNRLGDGCEVDFPMQLHSYLKWTQQGYSKAPDDSELVRKVCVFSEMLCIHVVKCHC